MHKYAAKLQKINDIRKRARDFFIIICVYRKKVVPLHSIFLNCVVCPVINV